MDEIQARPLASSARVAIIRWVGTHATWAAVATLRSGAIVNHRPTVSATGRSTARQTIKYAARRASWRESSPSPSDALPLPPRQRRLAPRHLLRLLHGQLLRFLQCARAGGASRSRAGVRRAAGGGGARGPHVRRGARGPPPRRHHSAGAEGAIAHRARARASRASRHVFIVQIGLLHLSRAAVHVLQHLEVLLLLLVLRRLRGELGDDLLAEPRGAQQHLHVLLDEEVVVRAVELLVQPQVGELLLAQRTLGLLHRPVEDAAVAEGVVAAADERRLLRLDAAVADGAQHALLLRLAARTHRLRRLDGGERARQLLRLLPLVCLRVEGGGGGLAEGEGRDGGGALREGGGERAGGKRGPRLEGARGREGRGAARHL
mmetsp:Transcript_36022/g.87462  ORF Transcript_36022/g.87462 Transcript_36022/m.87462 type:complete len:376 (-) Transcript_36022:183-1310(-)